MSKRGEQQIEPNDIRINLPDYLQEFAGSFRIIEIPATNHGRSILIIVHIRHDVS